MAFGNILVVDDEASVLKAWERALRLGGHTVTTAATTDEALRLCSEHAFDVVVLDFMMPAMTGVELLTRIRKLLPVVRSVIVSGKLDETASEEQVTASLKESVEADLFFHKPLSNEKLLTAVETLVSGDAVRKDWRDVAKQMVDRNSVTLADVRKAAKALPIRKRRTPAKK